MQPYLDGLIDSVSRDERIKVFLNSQITQVDGFVGNFRTTIESDRESRVLSHGVTIIASGASELKPDQYLYGKDPRVLTGLELQRRFIDGDPEPEADQDGGFYSVCRIPQPGKALLLPGLLHPQREECPDLKGGQPPSDGYSSSTGTCGPTG